MYEIPILARIWRNELLARIKEYKRKFFETDDRDHKRKIATNWAGTVNELVALDTALRNSRRTR